MHFVAFKKEKIMINKSCNKPLTEEEFEEWFQNTDLGELIPQEGGIVINRSNSKISMANTVACRKTALFSTPRCIDFWDLGISVS